MKDIVIVAAKRSPIGNFCGSLSTLQAADLGSLAIQAVLEKTGIDSNLVDEVIFGQVLQAGCGQNPARQALIKAGLNQSIPAITINKVCGSGMKSIQYAAQAIALGDAEVIIAGGQENMSLAPHVLQNTRTGQKLGNMPCLDVMLNDGLTCSLSNGIHMGITAENLAEKYDLSKQMQDEFALNSQLKATKAQQDGKFDEEIFTVSIPQRRGDPIEFATDEFVKTNATIENIAKVRAAFKKDGSVSAANASGINDGSVALLVMSADKAKELDLTPIVRVVGFASAGVDPTIMGIGPVDATNKLLNKIDWSIDSLDLIESNEAFAAQSLAVNKELGWDTDKVNVNGGAIALGHPIGASGARIVTTLIHEMKRSNKQRGLATMCIGGGQGIASAFELI